METFGRYFCRETYFLSNTDTLDFDSPHSILHYFYCTNGTRTLVKRYFAGFFLGSWLNESNNLLKIKK